MAPRLPPLVLVMPVKQLDQAKSRLGLPSHQRSALALRLMEHSVSVASSCPKVSQVLVVTSDARVVRASRQLGALGVIEPPDCGLNEAIRFGRQQARQLAPEADIAIMVSDLPELTVSDLTLALEEFATMRLPTFVADHHGIGTTMLMHTSTQAPAVMFGPGSAARHVTAGYRPAMGSLLGLRRDLDTPLELQMWRFPWDDPRVRTESLLLGRVRHARDVRS